MIDLHLHTTYSDGSRTPEELVLVTKDFQAIAITDHDTTEGVVPALSIVKKQRLSLKVIPGIELSSVLGDSEVHILGYGIDPASPELLQKTKSLKQERIERIRQTVDKLTTIGFPLSYQELPITGLPGRSHVARLMVKKGYVKSVDEAFRMYLNPQKPGYVPRNKLSPKDAVSLIHQAKGVAVLAHPGLLTIELTDSLLQEIPVDGIEVFHSAHTPKDTLRFEEFAKTNDLLITGGSDCHGPKGKDRELLGLVDLPEKYLYELLEFMDVIA
ncbi:MAG TPA: PHP domain-containing protein [Firmicutes bacterium]|nr:PHP domain-containing protein [Bacillota bacterium]